MAKYRSMRKDTIEERIAGIEKDMKELRSEIRQELRSMIDELKEFQTLMIEDRIGEVQETTSRQYCQMAYDNALAQAQTTMRQRMTNCPPGPARDECIDHMTERHLRRGITELDAARPEEVGATVRRILDRDAEERKSDAGTPCETCLLVYDGERDRLLAMGEKFVRYRQSLAQARTSVYFSQLPDDLAISGIVEPLSHKARFAMLKSLTSGDRSYKELGDITGYTGGHLLYHLNKLTDAGLTQKVPETGLYRITEKGTGVMEIVKKMYAQ
jgi:DNA-binding HxlR family transcriptional regulator